MGAPEVGQRLLHRHLQPERLVERLIDKGAKVECGDGWKAGGGAYLYGLRVVEVSAQVHQQLRHPGGHIVGAGEDAGAQAQDAGVTPHQV